MQLKDTTYQVENRVALITLNRPERLNAYTVRMRDELIHLLGRADQDDQVRAVVLTGAGRAFCAGMDLADGGSTFDFESKDPAQASIAEHRDGGGRVALAAFKCRKPVIAAMNGPAVGVGLSMTLAMDMRVAAEDAKMGLVFTRRGLVPEACSTWFLARLVGAGKALELACTGRVFRAGDQAGTGLFNYLLPADQVLPKALGAGPGDRGQHLGHLGGSGQGHGMARPGRGRPPVGAPYRLQGVLLGGQATRRRRGHPELFGEAASRV